MGPRNHVSPPTYTSTPFWDRIYIYCMSPLLNIKPLFAEIYIIYIFINIKRSSNLRSGATRYSKGAPFFFLRLRSWGALLPPPKNRLQEKLKVPWLMNIWSHGLGTQEIYIILRNKNRIPTVLAYGRSPAIQIFQTEFGAIRYYI